MMADFIILLFGNDKKLVPNFFDKGKYVLHYENLQLYSRFKLTLKKYIAYNSLSHMSNSTHKQE